MVEPLLFKHAHRGGLPGCNPAPPARQQPFLKLIKVTRPKSRGQIETPA